VPGCSKRVIVLEHADGHDDELTAGAIALVAVLRHRHKRRLEREATGSA
jgi:hypothetical protein